MILEHSEDPVSAKWSNELQKWDIGQKKKYRWVNHDKVAKPMSDWFYELSEALDWIIDYDKKRGTI